GELSISAGELEALRGYKFDTNDRILPPNRWSVGAHPVVAGRQSSHFYPARYRMEPAVGVIVTLLARPGCIVRISGAKGGAFEFRTDDIPTSGRRSFLDGDVQVTRVAVARDIGTEAWQDDYPQIAADRQGSLWVAWTSFHDGHDELG